MMHFRAGAVSELISSPCSFFNIDKKHFIVLLRDTLPTAFFPTLLGTIPNQSFWLLIHFYFQTPETRLWIIFMKQNQALN